MIVIGLNIAVFRSPQMWTNRQRPASTKQIPAEGVADSIDTKGSVPGDPNATVKQMHRLFDAITTYSRRHNGTYPTASELTADRVAAPGAYGFGDAREAILAFRNKDMIYSDRAAGSVQPEVTSPYVVLPVRHDGAPVGSPKQEGTKDALAWTDIYYHRNIRHYPGDKSTTNPVGFYLVLWDDNSVTRVNYKDVRFATDRKGGGFPEYFPGQAGLPIDQTLSYEKYQQWVNQVASR
jgi:hypothetical protein